MKAKLALFLVFVVFAVINLSAQNQSTRQSAASNYPWQQESISRKADKSWFSNEPNSNKSNFSRYERSRAHYKKDAKKAMKEAARISASQKASPTSPRPKSQKAYERKYFKDAKEAGINIKRNRRNS